MYQLREQVRELTLTDALTGLANQRALINALPLPGGRGRVSEEVPSPTFTLVQVYERAPAPVWHFDLYRVESPEEVVELGLDEALAEGIVLIEWPERLGPLRPAGALELALHFGTEAGARWAELVATPRWSARLRTAESRRSRTPSSPICPWPD